MATRESGLHDHTGYWLRRLSDAVHTRFERDLATRGVTVAQWNVLVSIYHGHAETTSDAARFIGTDVAAVSRLVDRLAAKDLLTRTVDPASRRRQPLRLTPRGRRLVPELIRVADRNDRTFFSGLTAAQRRALTTQLRQLLETALPEPKGTPT